MDQPISTTFVVGDAEGVRRAFDRNAIPVFAQLCHLSLGDRLAAEALLVKLFASLATAAHPDAGRHLSDAELVVYAHNWYLATVAPSASAGRLTDLSPAELAALNLRLHSGDPAEDDEFDAMARAEFRRAEHWLDDRTRAEAMDRISPARHTMVVTRTARGSGADRRWWPPFRLSPWEP